jgi:hypothetical protein
MNNKEIYTKIESKETELKILLFEDNTVHISLDDWDDFATLELSKEEAIDMAKTILNKLDEQTD